MSVWIVSCHKIQAANVSERISDVVMMFSSPLNVGHVIQSSIAWVIRNLHHVLCQVNSGSRMLSTCQRLVGHVF